jgi:hypothetical protein
MYVKIETSSQMRTTVKFGRNKHALYSNKEKLRSIFSQFLCKCANELFYENVGTIARLFDVGEEECSVSFSEPT